MRERRIGIVQSLQEAATRGVRVHVLTPAEDAVREKGMMVFGFENIEVRRIRHKSKSETSAEPRTKIIIVDRKEYLVVELKDDSKNTFVEAVRLAIHSTTQSTVNAYLMLFESLWQQSELYDQLEAHNKMQKEFINIATHELRTPIQPIVMLAQILQPKLENGIEKFELTKEQHELLLRNSKRMERLATEILEVARIESNTMKLNKEKFDMNEKIRNVIRDVKHTTNGVQIVELLGIDPILVEADKVRIFEVISNLIGNAIKFTREGEITVKAEKVGENVLVQVKDTGIGIDPEILPRLFGKFATKADKGTGLGLYISKGIVEAHGGQIWAENNNDGKGATFSFTIPIAE
jgi:two-component system, OmpR family, sensor histidine kinase VicK